MRFRLTRPGRIRPGTISVATVATALLAIVAPPVSAQDATWVGGTPSAASSDYFVSSNWTPATVPTGTATFGASANTNISFGSTSTVGGWTFSPGASAYTITVGGALGELDFTGAGITINGGSANIINNFFTQFHNSSSAGAASITNNFALYFWDTSNAGSANITTTSAVEFFNNSSPGSAAITAAGPLASVRFDFTSGLNGDYKLTVGSIAGDGTFDIGHNQLTVGSNNLSTTVDGLITDGGFGANGSLVKVGTGTLTLTAANSYAGGTTISDGILQVGNNSAVGTGAVTLDGGLFQADGTTDLTIANNFKINNTPAGGAIDSNGVSLTIAGNISDGVGSGKLTVLDSTGGGVLILTGTNTYSGGTTICFCGTLQLGDATHTASMVGDITNEGQFNIVNANTAGITSLINDGGLTTFNNATSAVMIAITNKNGGAIEFLDNSSAGSATIVNRSGAVTIFGDNSTAANANITNRSSGVTVFTDNSTAGNAIITTFGSGETLFFVAATGGNAQFVTNGSGVVDFSGSTGPNGDGRISAGSIAGSGTYVIGAGNTLVVGSNNRSTEVSGVIADSCGCGPGPGSLEKVGSGTLILSGTNIYTGTTTVNGGVLEVDGSIASSSLTTVNAGGALTGVGAVGDTIIANGGIFLAGNGTPGTSTTVSGNLAFQSGALYLVGINSTTSSLVNVTGTATLAGSVGVSVAAGSMIAKQYTILTAAGERMGTFSGADTLGATNLIANLSYDSNNVYLSFTLGYGATSSLNVNQSAVANTLVNFFNANGGINAALRTFRPAASRRPPANPQRDRSRRRSMR